MRPRAVVAIGGNALTRAEQQGTAEQIQASAGTMAQCVAVLRDHYEVVAVHGNGPQVGNLSIQQEAAVASVPAQPLHQLGAMTQGQLGSVLVREIDRLCGRGTTVAVVTHVEVDPTDGTFDDPTKPVGPFFERSQALELAAQRGWQVREDSGRGYRRVVPSPRPIAIVEIAAIRTLIEAGYVVLAAGGGGIPVSPVADGSLQGVDGVIDKDHAAVLLAAAVGAEELYLLTDVEAVLLDFGTPRQRPVHLLTVAEAEQHLRDGQFPRGSMGPKIEAALEFLATGGRRVVVTSPARLPDVVAGRRGFGTSIMADASQAAASATVGGGA